MDKKGIAAYIAIVFIVSYGIEALMFAMNLSPWVACALLLVPPLAAWIASGLSASGSYRAGPVWPIPKGPALRMTFGMPIVFGVAYGIASLAGFTRFDWDFGELMGLLTSVEQLHVEPQLAPLVPKFFFVMGLVLAIVLGPTAYAVMMLGNEYGWRGYLLPRLMPLGRWPAYVVTGLLWGLSILPPVLMMPGAAPLRDALRLLTMMVALSLLLGEVWNRSRHLGLTAVCSGCCLCQATTVWTFSVVSNTTLLPWAGAFDSVAIVAFLVLAFLVRPVFGKLDARTEQAPERVSE